MGKIFYIMGKSATGKDHFYASLLEKCGLERMVLYTTRPIRENETDGVEYYFVDNEKMEALRASGQIIEERSYQTVHGIWTYATADDECLNLKKNDYLGIGTLESYVRLQEYFGREKLVPLYIEVEDGERLARALKRERKQSEPKYSEMCRRFLADQEDFSEDKLAAAAITCRFDNSGEYEVCLEQLLEYIRQTQ